MVGGPKNIKLLADISFDSSLQATVLSSLLLFLCAWRYVDLDDIQWNEVVTSTARNFKNSWPLHLTFSGIINLCPNIWFIKNFKCQQYFFEEGAAKNTQIFHIFEGPLLRNGWPYLWCWRVLRDFCGLCNFSQNIAKVMSIWMSKVGQNSTAFKK